MNNQVVEVVNEVNKVISGKQNIVEKVLMAILAEGHILLEDVPGVGKTTLALAFSKVFGLDFSRIQFTPDVTASDVVGFTYYDRERQTFSYQKGAVMSHFILGDEINRTSSRTQSALLEVMEEGAVTVDGERHEMPKPFIVMATQNPIGSAGTQALPLAQLDRFMLQLSIGYPDFESQVELLRNRQKKQPLDEIRAVLSAHELIELQNRVGDVLMTEELLAYVTRLTVDTRNNTNILYGVSPRGALAICKAAKAWAFIKGRSYVIPEDIMAVFVDLCQHRVILQPQTTLTACDVLKDVLLNTKTPDYVAR
ncbi:AAA family ATPase [Kurthia sibirica]|uniref:AAA family ATPase n=1 Tax=Kurthia sibirica TaxID=202750 RepID=A0A2U3ALC2_9BACL|nr:MoxR family ATPase [Kurthia sibirica]PWI25345.1 AAA family ATPase [Kurthia sibirica]GEK34409.1 magnesium chelatase [Kurthia sibirica]